MSECTANAWSNLVPWPSKPYCPDKSILSPTTLPRNRCTGSAATGGESRSNRQQYAENRKPLAYFPTREGHAVRMWVSCMGPRGSGTPGEDGCIGLLWSSRSSRVDRLVSSRLPRPRGLEHTVAGFPVTHSRLTGKDQGFYKANSLNKYFLRRREATYWDVCGLLPRVDFFSYSATLSSLSVIMIIYFAAF